MRWWRRCAPEDPFPLAQQHSEPAHTHRLHNQLLTVGAAACQHASAACFQLESCGSTGPKRVSMRMTRPSQSLFEAACKAHIPANNRRVSDPVTIVMAHKQYSDLDSGLSSCSGYIQLHSEGCLTHHQQTKSPAHTFTNSTSTCICMFSSHKHTNQQQHIVQRG